MEFLNHARIAVVPLWAKIAVGIFLALMLTVNMYVGYEGLVGDDRDKWVEAGAFLMGNLLPISLLVLLAAVSSAGVNALKTQTQFVLEKLLPEVLRQLEDYPEEHFARGRRPKNVIAPRVHVVAHYEPGRCDADYKLFVPSSDLRKDNEPVAEYLEVLFRIELNVRKVNFALYLPKSRLEHLVNGQVTRDTLHAAFAHSLAGARLGADTRTPTFGAYTINPELSTETVAGRAFYRAVLVTALPDDFLYSAKDQLFFCQDAMFMIKSFIKERPELFESIPASEAVA